MELRVLFVCQNDFSAPTEKQVVGFAQELLRRGHAVAVTVGGDPDTAVTEGVDAVPGLRIHGHRFAGRRLRREDRAWAREFRPTVIHALNSRAPTVAAAADLRAWTGAPVVVHFEDDEWGRGGEHEADTVLRTLSYRARAAASAIRPAAWWHSTPRTLRWAAREAAALDALTPELAREVERRLGRRCEVVLPVTPDLVGGHRNGAESASLPDLGPDPIVLFTGTIWPVYLDDARIGLAAVAELQRRGRAVTFVHAGRVLPRYDTAELEREAGLAPGSAHWLGYLPFWLMPALMQRAAVLVQPGGPTDFNRLRLPAKLQAYLDAGRPTVTFAAGFGELLTDGEDALLTYTAEPAELAERIAQILDDPGLAARLSRRAPETAARLFDPGANVDALEAVYALAR